MSRPPVVLITGATGGLGKTLTKVFADTGWIVAAVGHRSVPVDLPPGAAGFAVTLEDPNSVDRLFAQVGERFQFLDALVCAAGRTADHLVARLDSRDWDSCLDINLRGPWRCARAAIPLMPADRGGHVIFIGSHAARGSQGQAAYASAKAGLVGLTSSLAREFGTQNVRINTILPGVMPTPMTAGLPPQTLAAYQAVNALNRLNNVEEVARFIAHLATTRNISGQVFQLDSRISPWA